VELLGGDIYLDNDYDSGIPGNPGTSIIINLKRPPFEEVEVAGEDLESGSETGGGRQTQNSLGDSHSSGDRHEWEDKVLPEHLNVLFVDDDAILRKLFSRSVKRVAPGWTMQEASNGESAIALLDQGIKFDLIFVDQ
jgi:PleD family two-component response regulator